MPRRARSGRRSTTRPPTAVLFPELRLGPAAPAWPAAATTRSAHARLGLLRDDGPRREPRGAAGVALPGPGHGVGLRQRVELAARAGRRRDAGHPRRDVRTVRPLDRDPRPPRSGLAGQPGGGAPACAQGAGRGGPASVEPRHVSRRPGTDRRPRRTGRGPVSRAFGGMRARWPAASSSCSSIGVRPARPESAADPAAARRAAARPDRRVPPAAAPTGQARTCGSWSLAGPRAGRDGRRPPPGPVRRGGSAALRRSATRSSSTPRQEPDALAHHRRPTCYRIPALALLLGALRRRRDGRRRLARRSLAHRPRADAGGHRQDRRPAHPRRLGPGPGRDPGRDRRDDRRPSC